MSRLHDGVATVIDVEDAMLPRAAERTVHAHIVGHVDEGEGAIGRVQSNDVLVDVDEDVVRSVVHLKRVAIGQYRL